VSSITIVSDAPNCGVTYDRNSFIIQATENLINRTNKMSIKMERNILGGFLILLDYCAMTFVPLNEASKDIRLDRWCDGSRPRALRQLVFSLPAMSAAPTIKWSVNRLVISPRPIYS
jgi:hypothetical protein